VERELSSTDRRTYELRLSAGGKPVLHQVHPIAEAHEAELLASLIDGQRAQLKDLPAQLATANDLDVDLHRGSGRTP
jgi:DNA-binding MarR family transcriptional regulator